MLIDELKSSFKHINGMWPNGKTFASEEERMKHWLTKSVIEQKIFEPAKRLLICDQGAEQLEEEKIKYDDFLKAFRDKPRNNSPQRNFRGSMAGSQFDQASRATPSMWRASTTSNF